MPLLTASCEPLPATPIATVINIKFSMTPIKTLIVSFCLVLTLNVSGQNTCGYKLDTAAILSNKNLDDFLAVLQTDSFIVTNDKKDIPRSIKKQLNCMTNGFSIANPGEPYQATDVVTWRIKPRPRRQLVFSCEKQQYASNDLLERWHW